MGLGVRLKELSFHLAGEAALEPPQTWEKSCRREVEGASEGVDAGGRHWRRPRGSRRSLVPHRHLSAVKGSGCKEVKSLPSMPKPSHSLCHTTGNIAAREAAPPELGRAVGHRGQWDAEGWGLGKEAVPPPRGCCCRLFVGSWARSDGEEKDGASNRPPTLPSPLPHPSVTAAVFAELRSLVKASQREGCEGTSLRLPTKAAPCLASGTGSSRGSGGSTDKGDRILPACPLPSRPLAGSPAPLGGHGTLPSPVSDWGCAQPCPAEGPGAISAGQQG